MRTVFLVKQNEADLARHMEAKLMALPISTGLLFVGVSVLPATEVETQPIYRIWVGCHRDFDEKLMDPLVRVTLQEEIVGGVRLVVEAHRGLSRPPIKSVDSQE